MDRRARRGRGCSACTTEAGAELLRAQVPDVEHWNRLRQRYLGLPPDPLDST